jgi:hypothetical protein
MLQIGKHAALQVVWVHGALKIAAAVWNVFPRRNNLIYIVRLITEQLAQVVTTRRLRFSDKRSLTD